jgi:ubiquinone/menaquinone biosynthesis C-methylase UbiE
MHENAKIVKEFFNTRAVDYGAWYQLETPQGHSFLERKMLVLKCVGTDAGILADVGCGPGVMSRELAQVASNYIGIDVAPRMVKIAKANAADLKNVQFRVGDAKQLDIPSRYVDTLCAIGLLEYLSEPHAILSELYRVLRPGGRLILSVPYRYSPWRIWERFIYLPLRMASTFFVPLREPYDLSHRSYSVLEYETVTKKLGFVLDRVEFYNFALLPMPCGTLFPRVTVKAARLGSTLKNTSLRFFGTGFVAVSLKQSGSGISSGLTYGHTC